MSDERDTTRGRARWLVALILVGLLGGSGAVLWLRHGPRSQPPAAVDERLERFIADAERAIGAGDLELATEQLHKASGLREADPRILEGLARVEILRAEALWWRLELGGEPTGDPAAELAVLGRAVRKAREVTGQQSERLRGDPAVRRLGLELGRLEALWLLALARRGSAAEARAELAARQLAHPAASALARLAQADVPPAAVPAASAAASTGAAAGASASLAAASASAAPVAGRAPAGYPGGGERFELDHEPVSAGPSTPGELELPAPPKPPAAPISDLP